LKDAPHDHRFNGNYEHLQGATSFLLDHVAAAHPCILHWEQSPHTGRNAWVPQLVACPRIQQSEVAVRRSTLEQVIVTGIT